MKKVIHLVGNNNIGGVRRGIDTMLDSPLSSHYDFSVNYSNKVDVPDPDIIIWHDAVGTKTLFELLKIRLKYPNAQLIIHEHHYSESWEVFNPPPSSVRFHTVVKLCFILVDIVVANSKANATWMLNNNLVRAEKIEVIESYNNVIEDLLALPIKKIEEPLVFGIYGRATRQKGIDVLLEALPLVEAQNIKFNIQILDNEPDTDYLRSKVTNDSRVTLFSKLDSVADYIYNCDVIIIPSRWEPFGQVCLEAKAAGKYVLASRVDGLVDQVRDYGSLVQPDSPSRLALAIDLICHMPLDTIQSHATEGRISVLTHYSTYLDSWSKLL